MPDVSQAAVVIGALLFGFVLFLAVNNKLGIYLGVLTGKAASS